MLAPPPGFSQLATSFLAWLHLGIPRALLPRLVCPCISILPTTTATPRQLPRFRRRASASVRLPKALFFPAPNTHVFNQQQIPGSGIQPLSRGLKTAPGLRAPFPCIDNRGVGQFVWCDCERVFRAALGPRAASVAYSPCSRKEVIQPQVPLRLPCYDFAPVTELAFGRSLSRLSVSWVTDFGRSRLPWRDGRCVQGPGTYSPRYG